MRIKGFKALRPAAERVKDVASVPYDTVNRVEARGLAEGKPDSFLRVVRADLEFDDTVDPYSPLIYERAAGNLNGLIDSGVMAEDNDSVMYVYRQIMGDHEQRGIVACSHVEDYLSGRIKKHEKTLKSKEDDRLNHVLATNANTGPVFLAYRDDAGLDAIVSEMESGAALYDFQADDGVRHTLWKMNSRATLAAIRAFSSVDCLYIADGHHRAAAASRAALEKAGGNPDHKGDEEYNWFMTVLFPASQLNILPYNRAVRDLNGMAEAEFLEKVSGKYNVIRKSDGEAGARGCCSMYLAGQWYGIELSAGSVASNPVESLDVSILQEGILDPLLGIADPRTSDRIEFIGGVRGCGALSASVDSGRTAVAFSMFPVDIEQVMAVSDAGMIMAPKCTWFEPKLRSGLLVHFLD